MLPIFASLSFNTAPTVFPVSVSVAKNPNEIKTVRSQLDQAELEPGTTKSIFRVSKTNKMNRVGERRNNIANSSGSGRRRSRTDSPPSLPQHRRVVPSEETRQPAPASAASYSAATSATPAFLSGWIDRMFCCSYSSAQQTFDFFGEDYENDIVVMDGSPKVVTKASLLNGTPLTERAIDNFPSLERARELRASASDSQWNTGGENPAETADMSEVEARNSSPKTKFFVLEDKMDDHKARLHFYKQDDNGMTRTSTATTASASSASSASSIQSWNTLPTQPSEDESSCLSAPSQGGNAIKGGAAGSSKRRRHRRRLTDPQLAEKFLMEQLREKLVEHGASASKAAAAPQPTSRHTDARRSKAAPRSVYHHPQPVE